MGIILLFVGMIISFFLPVSPEDQKIRLLSAYDSEKTQEIQKAHNAILIASEYVQRAKELQDTSLNLQQQAEKAKKWADSCISANQTGSLTPAIDCDLLPVDSTGSENEKIIGALFPNANADVPVATVYNKTLFINPGHGKGENGSRDWGATIYEPDGKTVRYSERSIVKAIAIKFGELVRGQEFSTIIPIGFNPFTLRENIEYSNQKAREANCTPDTCYLLSIHANMSDTSYSSGAVVYYNAAMPGARQIASRFARAANPENWRVAEDSANKNGRLGMVRDVEGVNSFLLEVGYMSNKDDLKRMLDSGKIASSLALEFSK